MATSVKPAWAFPAAMCCLALTLLLIAGTVILALIPVYLSTKDISANTTRNEETLSAGYASDAAGAGSDTLSDSSTLSSQLATGSGLSTDDIGLDSGSFLPSTASSRRKRQTVNSNGTVTCEKATGLTGDIFVAQYKIKYPKFCFSTYCRTTHRTKFITSLRNSYKTITVNMNFTLRGLKPVRLIFCGIFSSSSTGCTPETKTNAYLINKNSTLYKFDLVTYNVTEIGALGCSTTSNAYSIAAQRNGLIWAVYEDGNLYKYNIRSGSCSATTFITNQSDFSSFTMTFVKSPTDTTETLYVSKQNDPANVLGKIDTTNLTLTTVGNYSELQTYADLAALENGTLYGLFETKNFTIAQINTANATIVEQYPLNISSVVVSDPNYGFTVVNGVFFIFEGANNSTNIHTFNPSTNTLVLLQTIPQIIYGATVSSSCLGT